MATRGGSQTRFGWCCATPSRGHRPPFQGTCPRRATARPLQPADHSHQVIAHPLHLEPSRAGPRNHRPARRRAERPPPRPLCLLSRLQRRVQRSRLEHARAAGPASTGCRVAAHHARHRRSSYRPHSRLHHLPSMIPSASSPSYPNARASSSVTCIDTPPDCSPSTRRTNRPARLAHAPPPVRPMYTRQRAPWTLVEQQTIIRRPHLPHPRPHGRPHRLRQWARHHHFSTPRSRRSQPLSTRRHRAPGRGCAQRRPPHALQ